MRNLAFLGCNIVLVGMLAGCGGPGSGKTISDEAKEKITSQAAQSTTDQMLKNAEAHKDEIESKMPGASAEMKNRMDGAMGNISKKAARPAAPGATQQPAQQNPPPGGPSNQ